VTNTYRNRNNRCNGGNSSNAHICYFCCGCSKSIYNIDGFDYLLIPNP
jgi:hypothetical protein